MSRANLPLLILLALAIGSGWLAWLQPDEDITPIDRNGQPLPDYLFAFCPWLLASKMDDSAWYDSFAGDRTLTIEAVKSMPPFVRRFSWG